MMLRNENPNPNPKINFQLLILILRISCVFFCYELVDDIYVYSYISYIDSL